ncbi:hypothetical protein PsAD2_04460 [Pseudovibrio axinellae]|uniref:Uncharacterized protein n=1 Tax=Pseudovibrio axinellae TaxID=989403 RepID=A0A165SZY0_9HYPH|nr:ABZJ_00895 family protein [Pseudovibrio axinellae]KZL05105.1 hypothetical protein PsAD2_04460 [Pseudovibrio axinellae]SER48436.1 hypothetical protein SAMN05421798_11121 [Pseudovibrio axinellae]
MDRSQINLWNYAGRFTAIYIASKLLLFVVLLIGFTFFDVELPLKFAAYVIGMVASMLTGQAIYKKHGVRIEGAALFKLTALCLLAATAIDGVSVYFALPSIDGILESAGLLIGMVLFTAFISFWMIWFGFRLGFKTALKEEAKQG